jgi:hypothetical protein
MKLERDFRFKLPGVVPPRFVTIEELLNPPKEDVGPSEAVRAFVSTIIGKAPADVTAKDIERLVSMTGTIVRSPHRSRKAKRTPMTRRGRLKS